MSTWLRILFVFALVTCRASGQADMAYDVQDQIKTDKIDYVIERRCIVYSWDCPQGLPDLQYFVSFYVNGCSQKRFTYEEQDYNKQFSFKEYYELTSILKETNLHKLKRGSTSCLLGSLTIDGKDYYFNNPLGDPERDKLQGSILAFLDRAIPKSKRTVRVHTIEGDFEPPRDVTIHKLLTSPDDYDGKRVRVTGCYQREEDESKFSQKEDDDPGESLWLNGTSSFIPEADIPWVDDGHITVEGTFMKGPGGRWGAFAGEIQRVTKLISLDPPPRPKTFADQSSKRV